MSETSGNDRSCTNGPFTNNLLFTAIIARVGISLFAEWMKTIGFNGKQVAKAGETIGLGRQVAGLRYRGEKELSHTERLAMAAVTAGLPAWSPANHSELEAHGKVIAAVRDVLAR